MRALKSYKRKVMPKSKATNATDAANAKAAQKVYAKRKQNYINDRFALLQCVLCCAVLELLAGEANLRARASLCSLLAAIPAMRAKTMQSEKEKSAQKLLSLFAFFKLFSSFSLFALFRAANNA